MDFRLAALALLIGCELPGETPDPGPQPGPQPTETSGLASVIDTVLADDPLTDSCGDVVAHVFEESDSTVLVIAVDAGLAEQARVDGAEVTETYELPHPDVTIRALWGSYLSEWYSCDDVAERDPVIDGELDALSGTLTVTVRPHPDATELEPYGYATFHLEDVTFTEEAADGETLPDVELAELFVGWLPG
ncbi:MAG: hypothetical protein KTR31_17575 [Myxococcales bacterium]|nr:hypothetical protein [Myxococcales bacterium]